MHIDNRGFKDSKPNVLEVTPEPIIEMSAYKGVALHMTNNTQAGSFVYQESFSAPQKVVDSVIAPARVQGEMVPFPNFSVPQMGSNQIYSGVNVGYCRPVVRESVVVDTGNTIVYVADLNWWTTDADLENVLSCYGRVKEIKFFDERVSGKSKGYCEVEFYESAAATACKLGMDGHPFNGRPCVVSFVNPQSGKHTSSSHMNKTHVQAPLQAQGRKPGIDTASVGSRGNGPNYPTGDAWRNLGRGGHVMLNKGPVGGPTSGSGLMRPCNGNVTSGGPYGQGFGVLTHPQTMMAPGIVPPYMGRGTGYGSFTGPSFPGMMASFPAVIPMGVLPGTVPLVNPSFFARGMPSNVMMRPAGNEGPHPYMWTDTSVVGFEGEDGGGGDDNASEYGYGQSKEVKTGSVSRAKEWGIENTDEREPDGERDDGGYRYKEENDSYHDNQQKERDSGYRNDFDREQSRSSYSDSAKRRRPSE